MGHTRHLSRREIIEAIPLLGSGSMLLPLGVLYGQQGDTGAPAIIRGALRDGATRQPVAAKIRVTNTASGEAFFPAQAIKTMPQTRAGRKHYFYARGSYEVAVPPGAYQIEAIRGICHEAVVAQFEAGAGTTRVHDLDIPVLRDLHKAGWYSGNTHTHYDVQMDEDPDDRLRMVPPAEALDVSVISYLIRRDLPYITNRYPIGRLPQFSRDGTIMDMGEEARNNKGWPTDTGYGHCLFLNIPRLVEPVSSGILSYDGKAPDFPTLSMACAEAQQIGGTTVWCHNGQGMELPVAIALGNVNAYNLADGLEVDYSRYYAFLNCGFRLPVSSGTDWWIYDHNRVFVQVEGEFSYDTWIAGLRAGRTFVSNGPLLEFTVEGKGPGSTLEASRPLKVRAHAVSRLPFDSLEIVQDGSVVTAESAKNQREATLEREIPVKHGGWIAARVSSRHKTHADRIVFAHSGPIYYRVAGTPYRQHQAARAFIDEIEESMGFIKKNYRFASEADSAVALGRFKEGQSAYAKLLEG